MSVVSGHQLTGRWTWQMAPTRDKGRRMPAPVCVCVCVCVRVYVKNKIHYVRKRSAESKPPGRCNTHRWRIEMLAHELQAGVLQWRTRVTHTHSLTSIATSACVCVCVCVCVCAHDSHPWSPQREAWWQGRWSAEMQSTSDREAPPVSAVAGTLQIRTDQHTRAPQPGHGREEKPQDTAQPPATMITYYNWQCDDFLGKHRVLLYQLS